MRFVLNMCTSYARCLFPHTRRVCVFMCLCSSVFAVNEFECRRACCGKLSACIVPKLFTTIAVRCRSPVACTRGVRCMYDVDFTHKHTTTPTSTLRNEQTESHFQVASSEYHRTRHAQANHKLQWSHSQAESPSKCDCEQNVTQFHARMQLFVAYTSKMAKIQCILPE